MFYGYQHSFSGHGFIKLVPDIWYNSSSVTYKNLGFITGKPASLYYAQKSRRLNSFKKWDGTFSDFTKEELANNGLYYCGQGSTTR